MANVGMNDPFWELTNHISPDTILLIIDLVEDWVITEQPDITLSEACFLTNNFGVRHYPKLNYQYKSNIVN